MPDLRGWISQAVAKREALARRASKMTGRWVYALELQRVLDGDYVVANTGSAYGWHIEANDPAAVLRRCAADRKILARHNRNPSWADWPSQAVACHGCGTYGDCDWPVTDNLNDCPELLDLAEGYGITDEELAHLDRPQPPEQQPAEPAGKSALQVIDEFLWSMAANRRATPTSDVPAALRGPNWKARP